MRFECLFALPLLIEPRKGRRPTRRRRPAGVVVDRPEQLEQQAARRFCCCLEPVIARGKPGDERILVRLFLEDELRVHTVRLPRDRGRVDGCCFDEHGLLHRDPIGIP